MTQPWDRRRKLKASSPGLCFCLSVGGNSRGLCHVLWGVTGTAGATEDEIVGDHGLGRVSV